MVDLDGDGLADVLITGDDAFTWYPSLGLGRLRRRAAGLLRQSVDEERGPRLVFADRSRPIYLADMTGDGLTDWSGSATARSATGRTSATGGSAPR